MNGIQDDDSNVGQTIVKHYRHSQLNALSADATPEEIAEHKAKKRRLFQHNLKHGLAVGGHNLWLFILAVIWLVPIVWLIACALSSATSPTTTHFFPDPFDTVSPTYWTFNNFVALWRCTDATGANAVATNNFPTWFKNTLIISAASCVISTLFVLQVSFALSRMRFKGRKALMNLSMIMGLFPGMLTMLCIYFIFQYVLNVSDSNLRLIIAYSAASGLGYLVCKGFFDTVSKDIDEAAKIDGANEFQIFTRIIVPLSKPIIVYTILTSFMGPWVDFVYAKIILGSTTSEHYTVAIGLYNMVTNNSTVYNFYGIFCAGAVCISIPLSILFIITQKYYVAGITGGAVKG